jgi:ribosomal protein L20A (L18A)
LSDDAKINAEIRSYSRSQALDRTEDYLKRGRGLAAVPAAELKDRWVETYRIWCADVRNWELQKIANDIESELALRREEVPIERVAEEMRTLAEALKREVKRLDRDQIRRMGEHMLGEIEEYRRRSRTQN